MTIEVHATTTMATADIKRAKRYAVKFDPPCIFLEYEDMEGRSRVRAVKLVSVTAETDVERLTRKVVRSFPRSLDASSVKYEQVRKLVFKLVEHVRQHGPSQRNIPSASACSHNAGMLHATSTPTNPHAHPALSPKLPESNDGEPQHGRDRRAGLIASDVIASDGLCHSADSRFSTDSVSRTADPASLQAARKQDGSSVAARQGLTGLDDMLEDLDKELGAQPSCMPQASSGLQTGSVPLSHHNSNHRPDGTRPQLAAKVLTRLQAGSDDDEDEEELELVLEPDVQRDLNRVSELELRLAKQRMDTEFLRNQLRPGDEGFQYDRQVEFEPPTEDCGWDDTED